jgi:hypothetical protein
MRPGSQSGRVALELEEDEGPEVLLLNPEVVRKAS